MPVLNDMANHFRQIAQGLREIAEAADTLCRLTDAQRADLRHAADTLCRLEQLKRDLIATAGAEDAESDRLSLELMSLLNLYGGS